MLLQQPTTQICRPGARATIWRLAPASFFTIALVRNILRHQHQKALEDQLCRGLDAIKTLSRAEGFVNVVVRERLRNELRGKGVNVLRVVASILQVKAPIFSWLSVYLSSWKRSRQGILE